MASEIATLHFVHVVRIAQKSDIFSVGRVRIADFRHGLECVLPGSSWLTSGVLSRVLLC